MLPWKGSASEFTFSITWIYLFQSLSNHWFLTCIQYHICLTSSLIWEDIAVKLVSPAEEMQLEDNKLAFVPDPTLPKGWLIGFQLQNCYSWWWRIRRNFMVTFDATQQGWLEELWDSPFEEDTGSGSPSLIILKVILQRGRVDSSALICDF